MATTERSDTFNPSQIASHSKLRVTTIEQPATQPPASATQPIKPQVITDGQLLRRTVLEARWRGQSVGLVPTMGALHDGHLSLVDAARAECDLSVVTIFVNPTQFAPTEDFHEYPRELTRDLSLLAGRGCDLVFAPANDSIYKPNHSTFVDVGPIGSVLEGEFRPTHFRGVATVVMKLFQLVPADRAYFGRKDYQQTLVVRQMVNDLDVPIEIRICPTIRESDGLAMSSRNRYLTADERRRALALPRSLQLAQEVVAMGERDAAVIRQMISGEIAKTADVELQYIAFLGEGTMTPVTLINGPTTIALAVTVGKTRLIDNVLVGV
jgi:pantoate--beta-alanine ligase